MKTKMTTRLWAMLLCVLMCVSLLPAEVFAEAMEASGADFASEEVSDFSDAAVTLETEELPADEPNGETRQTPATVEESGAAADEPAEEEASFEAFEEAEEPESIGAAESLPYGFPGMGTGFQLSEEQQAAKVSQAENGAAAQLKGCEEGQDYVAGRIIYTAASAEEAQQIADAYDAELLSFSYGLAAAQLRNATVEQALEVSADVSNQMPAVDPEYLTIMGATAEAQTAEAEVELFSSGDVPQKEDWLSWKDAMDSDETLTADSYLVYPDSSTWQYQHSQMNTFAAWQLTEGQGITIAILSTGIADNADVRSDNVRTVSSTFIEDTTYGITDGTDTMGDGTAFAQLAAGSMGNGIAGAGVAPEANILSVRVLNNYNYGDDLTIARAIKMVAGYDEATGKAGTPLASVMFLAFQDIYYTAALEQAIQYAINDGVTVIAPAGDEPAGSNLHCYPGAYSISGLITVSAVDENGVRETRANYGKQVDVSAPGTNIPVLNPDQSGAEWGSGTYAAAAEVAGACALYMSYYGQCSPYQMESVLKASVNKAQSSDIGGVLDVSKFFDAKPGAPVVKADGTAIASGKTGTVALNGRLDLSPAAGALDGTTIIYTLNGKNPSILNGKVANGFVADGPITACPENGFIEGTTVTVKVAAVSPYGQMGAVTTVKIRTGYAAAESITIQEVAALAAGKSVTLHAVVSPADANQQVNWMIVNSNQFPHAKIDSKGVLSTNAKDGAGNLIVRATAIGSSVSATITIPVRYVNPVATVKLNASRLTLYYSANGTEMPSSYLLTAELYDKSKAVIPSGDVSLSWTSSRPAVATVDENGVITAVGKGKTEITCTAQDGSGKKAKVTVTVNQLTESITISGQTSIAPGKKAKYTAAIYPASANDKAVVWKIAPADANKAQVDSKGTVTLLTSQLNTTFTLQACSHDSGEVVAEKTISVRSLVQGISLSGGQQIYTLDVPSESGSTKENEAVITASVQGLNNADLVWTADKAGLVALEPDGYSCKVTGLAAGKVKITCAANDGSGKKATVSMQVVVPASSISIRSGHTPSYYESDDTGKETAIYVLAWGKSASNTAILGSEYGKPTVSKVKWTAVMGYDSTSTYRKVTTTTHHTISNYSNEYFSISDSGKLTVKSTLDGLYEFGHYDLYITVTATTTDGTNLSSSIRYYVSTPFTGLKAYDSSVTLCNQKGYSDEYDYYADVLIGRSVSYKYFYHYYYNAFSVTSSNPEVASAYMSDLKTVTIVAGEKPGKATITVKATDGTGKSCKINVTVK